MKKNFGFLLKLVQSSYGELDLALREDYFNIYYKGNSLAKVKFQKKNYRVTMNRKFIEGTSVLTNDNRFVGNFSNSYYGITLSSKLVHPFFQEKYMKEFQSNIKRVNHGEEMTLEQALITDNYYSDEYIILDRQVQVLDKSMNGRIDLLGAKRIKNNTVKMMIFEVKRGDNIQLKNEVADQMEKYKRHIEKNFEDYKECYERRYKQMEQLDFYENHPSFGKEIEFIEDEKGCVDGMIVVVGYSQLGDKNVQDLKKAYPQLKVVNTSYKLS